LWSVGVAAARTSSMLTQGQVSQKARGCSS
jgi:hypothetical protein